MAGIWNIGSFSTVINQVLKVADAEVKTVAKAALPFNVSAGVPVATAFPNLPFVNIDPEVIKNIKETAIFRRDIQKLVKPDFERFARNYIDSEPELLFVCDYIVDDIKIGSLLVFEKFFDSTHYEVFKKNIFKENATFERILFLNVASLEEEKRHFLEYLNDTLDLKLDEEKILVVLDTTIKEDRIYEYKIKAARVPQVASDVDYDLIMESKSLLRKVPIDVTSPNTLFDTAGVILSSEDLAWVIALVNEEVSFFGRAASENPLGKLFINQKEKEEDEDEISIFVPIKISDVMAIMNDSFSLFDVKLTFEHFLRVLGGLPLDFRKSFSEAIDNDNTMFSYDKFRDSIKAKIPSFNIVFTVSESHSSAAIKELSKLSIFIPANTGGESLASIEGISKVLKYVNDTFISGIYAQDKDTTIKVKEIIAKIESGEFAKDPVVTAATATTNTTTGTIDTTPVVSATQPAIDTVAAAVVDAVRDTIVQTLIQTEESVLIASAAPSVEVSIPIQAAGLGTGITNPVVEAVVSTIPTTTIVEAGVVSRADRERDRDTATTLTSQIVEATAPSVESGRSITVSSPVATSSNVAAATLTVDSPAVSAAAIAIVSNSTTAVAVTPPASVDVTNANVALRTPAPEVATSASPPVAVAAPSTVVAVSDNKKSETVSVATPAATAVAAVSAPTATVTYTTTAATSVSTATTTTAASTSAAVVSGRTSTTAATTAATANRATSTTSATSAARAGTSSIAATAASAGASSVVASVGRSTRRVASVR